MCDVGGAVEERHRRGGGRRDLRDHVEREEERAEKFSSADAQQRGQHAQTNTAARNDRGLPRMREINISLQEDLLRLRLLREKGSKLKIIIKNSQVTKTSSHSP